MTNSTARRTEWTLFILILLIGAVLRFVALDQAPPGLTHDEADHAQDAIGVVEGIRPIYFTVGYGREPLYDYSTALVMIIAGKNYMSSRLTSALFGMGLMLVTYGWVMAATRNRRLALAVMLGLAVGFWPVQVSRHALRTITLPVLFMASAWAFRRGYGHPEDESTPVYSWAWFALAGLLLGGTFYTYLAARVMWIVFPVYFVYLALSGHGILRRIWPGLIIMTVAALLVAAPLGWYLQTHPTAEIRIGQLSGPIDALLAGDPQPLLTNVRAGLGMITISGDDLWLYNIPGKPLLGPVVSLLFYVGISIAIFSTFVPYRSVRIGRFNPDEAFRIASANTFMLMVLGVGIVPALITGVGASNTRVIGMLPALYYFPALAMLYLANWAREQADRQGERAMWIMYVVIFIIVLGRTTHDYFVTWNNARDVRVAYHTTLNETLDYIDSHPDLGPQIAISTITPGPFHDPAVAVVRLQRDDVTIKWFDGRSAFLFPAHDDTIVFYPEVASPDQLFTDFVEDSPLIDRIFLRPDDFNRIVEVRRLQRSGPEVTEPLQAQFGDQIVLVSVIVAPTETIQPGQTIEVLTMWRILAPVSDELVLFNHIIDSSGQLIAQQDQLSYPTRYWEEGDVFVQIHLITLPADVTPGQIDVRGGFYTLPDVTRLPVIAPDGTALGDTYLLDTIEVVAP